MTLKIEDFFHASNKEPYNPKVIGCLCARYKKKFLYFMVAMYEPNGPRAIAREKSNIAYTKGCL